ncbi:Outer membrane protein beta-barrel domain-containing protein [Aquiflexum balticum DSM 16537]|uniref:Outer membrane protein beta-barrel domain-containing protein n=1 Tax=Aquiflexum balticum DSM 16537 TaxID=758820 RepID=A0A1W2GXU7_9BACT|nr:porin family protein [Aquiflexum balticum]SMD41527.1 Outer membrane protein beta-barrel domain-containing protein [Aquiflexum balticum DSM 16537]
MKVNKNLIGKALASIFIAIAMVSISHVSLAQDRWSFEVRPGVNFATTKLGEANLNTGFGAEGTFAYRFMPNLSVYAGWSWNKFGSDQKVDGTNLDFEETGYTYGLQYTHPLGDSNINLLVRAGGLANHIEVEKGSDVISDSGHGFGWQIEGGLAIPLSDNWELVPSVRYRSLSRDIEIESVTTAVDLKYISLGLGIVFKF